jgi:hypothetical protein
VARLNRYITEITRLKDREAKRIVLSKLSKLEKLLDKQDWNLDADLLATIMLITYEKDDITFGIGKKTDIEISKQEGRDFILGAGTSVGGGITVYINGEIKIRNKENLKNSKLIKELIEVLSHELVHREQWLKSKDKMLGDKGFDPDMSMRKYLSLKFEIEAHAHDAAVKLHNREEAPELEVYKVFGTKHPVYKRFMKKVFQFRKELEKRDET